MTIDYREPADAMSAGRALDDLRRTVAGRVHLPGDPEWDRARTPWAVHVDQTPLAVVEVADAEDVRRAVRWAVKHGYQVTAQPVGHGATESFDGVLLLRTRALNGISIDLAAQTATVGAGVKAGELLDALQGTGLTFLAGSNPDPSVVGLTITGGMSWFGRAYGLGANAIVAVELVDGLGRVRDVNRATDPDLFWAVRGGGGDFGIITALQIRLFPAPELQGGRLLWPVEQMPAVLRAFREVTANAPEHVTLWYHTYQFPPFPELPEPIRGRSFASVAATVLGSAAEAEHLLRPLRAVPGLELDLVWPIPMNELAGVADEPVSPTPSVEHSLLLDDLSDEVIDGLSRLTGAGSGSPLAVLQLRHLGGAFRHRHPGDGAAGHIDQPYMLFAMGIPVAPEVVTAIRDTFDRLDACLVGHTDGTTVPNFLGSNGDPARAWSVQTRDRLAEIKRTVDPLLTIRSNRPVMH